jgi:hypothetical protein
LNELVDQQTQYLKKRVPLIGKNIELIIESTKDISIQGNTTLLGWAIENVIRNGIDSINSSNGMVNIKISASGQFGLIHIRDNGNGIQKKNWKNIFRPGFSTKHGGWGLGLSLVSRIIKDIHGGEIKVIDSAKGVGTTFEIRLKRAS